MSTYERDALILLAIVYSTEQKGQANLTSVFAACDAIYRISPFYDDLNQALNNLLQAGLISGTIEFKPTAAGEHLCSQAQAEPVFDWLENLEVVLRQAYKATELHAYEVISRSAYAVAYQEYHH